MPGPDRQGTSEGLTSAEAAERLRRYGPNELALARRFETVRRIAGWLASPLIVILLLASVVSAVLGQAVSSVVIGLMVVLGAALNVVQAYRSEVAARRLRERVGQRATVVRDGVAREIPAALVVPDDIIHLAAGDLVPADGALTAAKDLFLNEAALTGESLPAEKHAGGRLFRGTSVVSGVGVARVEATGAATELGRIAAHLTGRPPETEFERGTRQFGFLILQVVVFLVLFVFLVNAVLRHDLLESFLFSVALAVGLTPELLPMIVSITLASGAVRMAKKKVIVKQLAAIENFGSMDILCSDKTGTLTAGEIAVDRHVNLRGESDETVIRLAALNSVYQTGLRSPMDDAILRHEHPAVAGYARIDEIPFDFDRRRVSVVVTDGGGECLVIVKGAPESVLPACTHVELDGVAKELDTALLEHAQTLFRRLSGDGFRVLAVAYRPVERRTAYAVSDECDLTLAGFAAFLDPARDDVAATIAALRADGVTVKILTGDNELVTQRICATVGLATDAIVLGAEVDRRAHHGLRAGVPYAEEPDHPGAPLPRARRRLRRRRHQRRAGAAERRRRHFGRQRGGCGAGRGRHHPAREAVERAARRRRRGPAGIRQHHEVRVDGHQLELRQHAEHGRGGAAPAVLADAAAPDPLEQPPLRPVPGGDSVGSRRPLVSREASPLERRVHPALHAGAGPHQLGIRFSDLRRDAGCVPRRAHALPDRLVRRVAGDPDPRDLRHPHGGAPMGAPTQPRPYRRRHGQCSHRRRASVHAARRLAGIRAAAADVLRRAAGDDRGVPRARRGRQALVLPPISGVGRRASS